MVGCWHTPSLPAVIVSPSRICRDHKFRDFASVGLLDSNETWVTPSHERTNADVTAPTFGGDYSTVILSSAPPSLSTPIRCLSLCSASNALKLATQNPPSTLSLRPRRCLNPSLLVLNPLSLPPSFPGRLRLVPDVPPAARVLPELSTHHRLYCLGHMHSRRVSDMHKYAWGTQILAIAIENFPICLKAKLHKANMSTSSTREATVFISNVAWSCNLPKIASVFVAPAACIAKRMTYCCVTISASRFTALLFAPRLHPSSGSPSGWVADLSACRF
jgi:hypothetical protein